MLDYCPKKLKLRNIMARLIDRNKQIPNGFIMAIPGLAWRPAPFSSIRVIAEGAITVLKANPHIAQKLGWDLSLEAMMNRVDETNAMVCERLGWTDYITGGSGGAATPFPSQLPSAVPRLPNAAVNRPAIRQPVARSEEMPNMSRPVAEAINNVKKVAAGAATLLEWEEAGMPAVDQETANRRAQVCVQCPKNGQEKHLTDYFTEPLAALIRKRFERMKELKIETPFDDKLKTCDACLCPMRSKVWFTKELVLKRLKPEWKAELNQANPRCWILQEIQ